MSRLFGIQTDGRFTQFRETPFQLGHEEEILENWLEENPNHILEDGPVCMVGRQVKTNLGGFIDLLAVDKEGNLVVIELKRDRTPRDTLAQALEYASFAEKLQVEDLNQILANYLQQDGAETGEYLREYFKLGSDDAIVLNQNQRIVIVGQNISPEVRQTSSWLRSRNILTTCVEFTFFLSDTGQKMMSTDIVVGRESPRAKTVSSGSKPRIGREEFMKSLDSRGMQVFGRILDLAEKSGYPIHWGTKGFSLNVSVDGSTIPVCYGYPPHAVFKQTVYSAFGGAGSILAKTAVTEDDLQRLKDVTARTGLFKRAGQDYKLLITNTTTDEQVEKLLDWIRDMANRIAAAGPRKDD